MARLAAAKKREPPLSGRRVVLDVRPMQEPERWPLTAEYLSLLLDAFARNPLDGESFVLITRAMRPDPGPSLAEAGLPVTDRRVLPPTSRLLRSAGLTLDSFLLRGAEMRTNAGPGEPAAVFHTAGGAVPLGSRLPVVATLLDMAAWELPATYAASPAARFGHRLRARVLHDAARVIVCAHATAESARRRLHLPLERISIVPLAADGAFTRVAGDPELAAGTRAALGLPARYLAFAGRYDARKDTATLFRALAALREAPRAPDGRDDDAQPEPPLLVFASLDGDAGERALVERSAERAGVADLVRVVDGAAAETRAAVVAGAQAFVYPALSEATALPVIEALALGVPVIASRAGALPETVGSAGIVVEPRDVKRLAAAIDALWAAGSLAEQLRRRARRRAETNTRTWADIARETRAAYASAAPST
jgi:glycosyltransferase involved in cell wall biosynthesis